MAWWLHYRRVWTDLVDISRTGVRASGIAASLYTGEGVSGMVDSSQTGAGVSSSNVDPDTGVGAGSDMEGLLSVGGSNIEAANHRSRRVYIVRHIKGIVLYTTNGGVYSIILHDTVIYDH